MLFNKRAYKLPGLLLLGTALVVAACSERSDPLGPDFRQPEFPAEQPLAVLECSGSTATRAVVCAPASPGGGVTASELILGGQGEYVHLRSNDVEVVDDIFSFNATVQNLIRQPIGTEDGTTPHPDGIRVFFENLAVTGGGGGTIDVANADGTGDFTGPDQPYFRYSEVLADSAISGNKTWQLQFSHPSGGDVNFVFHVYVAAAVPFPNGWVEVEPAHSVIGISDSLQLAGTVYNRVGRVISDEPLDWTSDDTDVATVSSTGEVAGVSAGSTLIHATSPGGRTGFAEVIVNTPVMARDTAYDALGNVTLSIAAPGLLLNVEDPDGGTPTIVPGTAATAEGGTVVFNADGSYTYLTAAGFTGRDSVQYTASDGVATASAWLVLTSDTRYWHVEAGAEATGANGTDAAPFPHLAGAAAVWVAGDTTLVLHGDGTTIQGAVTLLTNQGVIGEGIGTDLVTELNGDSVTVLAAGMSPAIGRSTAGATLTLGADNVLRGVSIGSSDGAAIAGTDFGTLTTGELYVSAAGPALSLTNGTLAGTFEQLASTNSTGRGLSLVGVAGTLAPGGGAINGAAGAGIYVEGGTVDVSYPGAITNSAGRSVHVTGRASGGVTLSGDLTDTGTGILVHDNTGGTVSFTGETKSLTTGAEPAVTMADNVGATISFANGGLAITTTSGIGFSSTGGGTLTVTGDHNTVGTGTGVAVSIVNTTIGGGGVTFRNVSGSGAGGIVLHTTGTNPFVVTGDGTTAGSGGTIAATAGGTGVSLTTTGSVTLNRMTINGAGSGIVGDDFGTLSVTGTSVNATAAPALNLFGGTVSGAFSGVSSSGSATVGVALNDVAGTWSVQGGSVVGSANGAAMLLSGNSGGGTLTWSAALSQSNGHPVLNVSSHTSGTLNLNGGLSSTGTSSGLRFAGANGTYNITPSSATTLTGSGGAISFLTGSAGAFTFSGNVHASYSAGTTVPFVVNGASPTATFNGNLTKGGSATGAMVSITDHGIGGGITFQNGTLNATAGDGILLSNADGTVSFNGTTTLNGGNARVQVLNGSSGTISFGSSASVTNPSGELFAIHNSAPTFTYAGAFTKNNNSAIGINAQNNTGGSITFSGATKTLSTGAANAIHLVNNGSTTFLFSGGNLNITTNGGRGIRGVTNGTLRVSGSDNTIASTSGAAIDLDGVTIGTGGLTFRRIDASGDSVGIRIRESGSTAGLTVTGTGAAGTGGVIQNTQSGASFSNAVNVNLNWMNFTNANTANAAASVCDGLVGSGCRGAVVLNAVNVVTLNRLQISGTTVQQGIVGTGVTNATVTNNTISGAGDALWEHGIRFFDLLGRQNTITGNSVSASGNYNLFIQNRTATDYASVPDSVLISGNTFSNPGHGHTNVNTKSNNVVVLARTSGGTSGHLKAVITGNTLTNNIAAREAIDGIFADASTSGKMRAVITSNSVTGHNIPINVASAGSGSVLFDISNNTPLTANNGNGINVASNGSGFISGRIHNNTNITTSAANTSLGIDVVVDATGHAIVEITNNAISGSFLAGMRLNARGPGVGQLDATLSGNTATVTGAFPYTGLLSESGNNVNQGNRVCLNLATPLNNFRHGSADPWEIDIWTGPYAGNTFQLQGLTGSGTDYANVANWLSSRNEGGARVDPAHNGVVNYVNAVCQTRTLP